MSDTNVIPSYFAAGSYTANNPFDMVVRPEKYYKVEALRSVNEMLGDNQNMFKLIFEPAGVTATDYQNMLDDVTKQQGAILVLIASDGSRVYVPTTYLKSFPLTDGVSYERLCLVIDLGAVPPDLKNNIEDVKDHFANYAEAHIGVKANVQVGTMPTIGYVSAEQHKANETTRLNKIAGSMNDVVTVATQEETIAKQAAYIVQLETALKAAQQAK